MIAKNPSPLRGDHRDRAESQRGEDNGDDGRSADHQTKSSTKTRCSRCARLCATAKSLFLTGRWFGSLKIARIGVTDVASRNRRLIHAATDIDPRHVDHARWLTQGGRQTPTIDNNAFDETHSTHPTAPLAKTWVCLSSVSCIACGEYKLMGELNCLFTSVALWVVISANSLSRITARMSQFFKRMPKFAPRVIGRLYRIVRHTNSSYD